MFFITKIFPQIGQVNSINLKFKIIITFKENAFELLTELPKNGVKITDITKFSNVVKNNNKRIINIEFPSDKLIEIWKNKNCFKKNITIEPNCGFYLY